MNNEELKRGLLNREILNRPSLLFRGITDKLGQVGKDSYIAALSTIDTSRKAGKTAVLKMEIASRKTKMKKLFSKLGELAYSAGVGKAGDIFQDASVRGLIDGIKSYDDEIKEIEQYIASLESATFMKRSGADDINGRKDIWIVEETFEGEKNTKDALRESDPGKKAGLQDAPAQTKSANNLLTHVEALKDKDIEVRIKALKELFKFEGLEAIPHMISALMDKDAEVRRRAASYLGWKVAVSAAPALITAAKDKKPSVRKASFEALGELGTKEAVPALIKGLDDRDHEVRKSAYKSLTKVTGEFIEFNAGSSLSERFKSIQRWEKKWGKGKG
ncbi:MAG: HEAT repeat domain-containing protein [Candidatus Omnitrophota bacterium]